MFSDPTHWCVPLRPDDNFIERFALACRNYVVQEASRKHPEIAYRILRSNVFCLLLDVLDPELPGFRHNMTEVRNAMTAAMAIIKSPAF